jgi:hypothetical protein
MHQQGEQKPLNRALCDDAPASDSREYGHPMGPGPGPEPASEPQSHTEVTPHGRLPTRSHRIHRT